MMVLDEVRQSVGNDGAAREENLRIEQELRRRVVVGEASDSDLEGRLWASYEGAAKGMGVESV